MAETALTQARQYRLDQGLSAEQLRALVHYDQQSGAMTWLVKRGGRAKAGTRVGSATRLGYLMTKMNGKQRSVHRLAWLYVTGEWPTDEIDHINGEPADNRWENLRQATRSQNCANRRVQARSTVGVKGVSMDHGRYRALAAKDGRIVSLGTYDSVEEAAEAYRRGAPILHGEYFRGE